MNPRQPKGPGKRKLGQEMMFKLVENIHGIIPIPRTSGGGRILPLNEQLHPSEQRRTQVISRLPTRGKESFGGLGSRHDPDLIGSNRSYWIPTNRRESAVPRIRESQSTAEPECFSWVQNSAHWQPSSEAHVLTWQQNRDLSSLAASPARDCFPELVGLARRKDHRNCRRSRGHIPALCNARPTLHQL